MQRITAIVSAKRKPGRYVVKVDGRAVATLRERSVADLGLAVDQLWDERLATDVARAAAFDKAYGDAATRLNRRAMSRRQLHDKLRQLGHDRETVDQVMDKLESLRLVDDEALGRELIRQIADARPAGAPLLRSKLMQRGLDHELIDRLLDELAPTSEQAAEGAAELARKKLRTMTRLDPNTRKRRLWSMLARRGFDSDTIQAAMADLDGLDEMDDT